MEVSRIEWFLQAKPDYLLVALGGNDGLRGIPVQEMKKNIDRILKAAKQNEIPTMLAGMKIPTELRGELRRSLFRCVSGSWPNERSPLIPFLLEGVGGNPNLNLPDRIHPNPLGHRKICQTVYRNLVSVLDWICVMQPSLTT